MKGNMPDVWFVPRKPQRLSHQFKDSNQKVDFSELVIIEEVLRNVSLEEIEEEGASCDDLDSSEEEEEEAISDTD